MGVVYQRVQQRSQFVRLPTRINSFILYSLLKSSGAVHYCHSSSLSKFCYRCSTRIEVSYMYTWSINLALPINSDCLQMWLLGYIDQYFFWLSRIFRRLFRASYDWNSRLHVPSLAHCHPLPHPFSIYCVWNGRIILVLYFRLDGMEQNGNVTFFWLLQYIFTQCKQANPIWTEYNGTCTCTSRQLLLTSNQTKSEADYYSQLVLHIIVRQCLGGFYVI